MANEVQTYDPKDIQVIVGGNVIGGFGEELVRVEREANAYDDEAGAQGEVVRYATNDKRGTITLILQQTSQSNLYLSTLAKADEYSGTGVVPVVVKDTRGNDLHLAPQAWIQKVPQAVYRKGVEMREWVIRTANLQSVLGGAA